MPIIADTHVHVYPVYDIALFLRQALHNLNRLAVGVNPDRHAYTRVLCLTERRDCDFYRQLVEGRWAKPAGFEVEALPAAGCVRLRGPGADSLLVFAGRQIVTRERIEVLALTVDLVLPDGRALHDVMDAVLDAGAVPVLSWAPGKWFFERGRLVANALDHYGSTRMALGDSSLRPTLWPEPGIMTRARSAGFRVLAGSDPLPFAGEEKRVGTYGVWSDGLLDEAEAAQSLRRLLLDPVSHATTCGHRGGVITTLRRLKGHHDARRRAARGTA